MSAAILGCLVAMILSPVAEAFPLRVVSASELQIEPRVAADRSAVTFSIHLQDDRRAPLVRRAVRMQISTNPARVRETREVTTDATGEAQVVVPLTAGDRRIEVTGEFSGDRSTSPATHTVRLSPDAPFVTLDLALDSVVEAYGAPARAVITVHGGQVVAVSVADLSVDLVSGDRTLAVGVTDASGRAELTIPASAMGEPGVRRVRPRVNLPPETVVGSERNLVVRARTGLTLERSSSPDALDVVVLSGALASARQPVRDASIRIMFGSRAVAGARTNAQGGFEVRVPNDVLVEHDVVVRAVFDPTEPWYEGATSPSLTLTGPAPSRIGWSWLAAPLALSLAAVALYWSRSIKVTPPPMKPVNLATEALGPRVERIAASTDGTVKVRLTVVDHASGGEVLGAHVRLTRDGEWAALTSDAVTLSTGKKMLFDIGAEGFAPRTVEGNLPGPGEYAVRVSLRSWREELFDRARRWLRASGRSAAMPTPREVLDRGGHRGQEAEALVFLVERGCYGPNAPGAAEVAAAEALVSAAGSFKPE